MMSCAAFQRGLRASSRPTAHARRLASTASASPSPTFLGRYRRAVIWSTSSLAIGATLGTVVSHTIAPPPHPAPGTHEDAILMHDLETRIDDEFKVKVLRGKCTAAAANLRGDDGSWRELAPGSSHTSLVNESLAGARALGVERLFWNEKAQELVAVVWFGGATSGWPGVTHGGCIAIVMGEKMALAARLAKHGLEAQLPGVESTEANHVDVTYKKPTYANAFYVVRMLPRVAEDLPSTNGDVEVAGTLETLDGKICVAVSGLVPVSGITASSNASSASTGRAKSWIGWPSRSQTPQG